MAEQSETPHAEHASFTDSVRDVWRTRRDIAREKGLQQREHEQNLREALVVERERRTRPVTFEMSTALERIHETLPPGAIKTLIERLRRPMRVGTRAIDFFGRTYDRAMIAVVLLALRGPAYFAAGTPARDQTRVGMGPRSIEFGAIAAGRPLVLMGFQPRLEVLPVAIVASMMPRLRRFRARQAAISLEAFAKSRIGQQAVRKIDARFEKRVDTVMRRFDDELEKPVEQVFVGEADAQRQSG